MIAVMTKTDDLRRQALRQLEQFEVLMRNGHFDYGNGFHGRVYLNPHQLFRHPSTIWRLAQDLLDELNLLVYPVVVGSGKRLFENGMPPKKLKLVNCSTTNLGVAILTYQPARQG